MAVIYVVFLLAIRLQKLLGVEAITAMERLMGLVLTAIAVEMLLGGVSSYIRDIPAR
jgi:small neutral amino acid transporter SnatA (MarC family)